MHIRLLPVLLCLALAGPAVAADGDPLNRVVAVVNDRVITAVELEQEVDQVVDQLTAQRVQLPPEDVLREQVLNRLVLKRLQLEVAENRRIRIDDETLNRTIEGIAQRNNMDIETFREVLERDGFDFAAYREDIRDEMIVSRLRQQAVANQVSVSEQEVDDYIANESLRGSANDEYKLAHILVSVPEAASPEAVKEARERAADILERVRAEGADFAETAVAVSDGQRALEGGELGWRKAGELPTLFADRIVAMEAGEVSDVLRSPSGFHILKLQDRRRADIAEAAWEYHARHILIRPSDQLSAEEARRRIAQLRDRVRSGEDFAELAQVHSEDANTAVDGGDLGWMDAQELTEPFPRVLSTMEAGDLSEPVQTRFGWHLIELMEKRRIEDTDELLRNRARQLIQQRKAEEAEQDWLRRLRDEAFVEYRL